MRGQTTTTLMLATLLLGGCVSKDLHRQTLQELEATREAAEAERQRIAAELEALKQSAATEADRLRKENIRLAEQLANAERRADDEANRAGTLSEQLAGREQELAKREQELASREQELSKLRQLRDEHERVTAKLTSATQELEQAKGRVDQLTAQLQGLNQESARAREEHAAAMARLREQEETLKKAEQAVEKLHEEQQRLQRQLEQEQAAKAMEIDRLTQTQAELAKTLESEIAKGEIRVQQVQDRLTINMVDRVLFDSGQGHVRPTGLKVLKQVSEILKDVTDKQIRIEGHTDNVPIRGKLKERFPSNWELSTARATSVVRYLVDEGGIDPRNISAVGYADTRPIATNETDEGRSANRRIEIVLYPKDLKEIVGQITRRD